MAESVHDALVTNKFGRKCSRCPRYEQVWPEVFTTVSITYTYIIE
ncbi:hypothetical protein [Mammaliicoccus sciuri]|nr:hypothetical protein [Mammaliicoccus sciuri]